jgi:hypothetical protein
MTTCANCAAEIQGGHEVLLRGKGKNSPDISVCFNCADELDRVLQAETEAPNLAAGLLAGLVAAALGSLIWYGVVAISEYQLGIIAVAVGWFVAQAVMFGAGRKRGRPLQLMSAIITLLAMALSEYLIVRHFIVEALRAEGQTDFLLFLAPADMLAIIVEGIRADPLTLLFWAIALWVAFSQPASRRPRRITPWSASE